MQRVPATVIWKAINEECPWENLPKRLQACLSSKEEWHKRITEHCIKRRLQWNNCFAHQVCRESESYEEMMRYLRKNLVLFPYHLAEYICHAMRVSVFRYYCDMIFDVMRNATQKLMWKLNKSIAKEFLPTQPADFVIEPLRGVCLVNFTMEEFKKLSEEEMATIDKICMEEANAFILFDRDIIKGLYRRGLVYFDVPVYPDDPSENTQKTTWTRISSSTLFHTDLHPIPSGRCPFAIPDASPFVYSKNGTKQ